MASPSSIPKLIKMKPKTNEGYRAQRSNNFQRGGQGPVWVLVAGGALLSTLSVHLGFKLKQFIDSKQRDIDQNSSSKGKLKQKEKTATHSHLSMYSYMQDEDDCFNCVPGTVETDHHSSNGMPAVALPLVTVPTPNFSPDLLELPPKPFHHSNCSAESPCVSECGSDIFTKREVVHKLRQQLKRRDEMILEMQDQVAQYQNSLNAQLEHSAHLQAQLDAANRDLFHSEREIQRLRKVIADHCVGSKDDLHQYHSNGYVNGSQNGLDSSEMIKILKNEVGDLKEVIEDRRFPFLQQIAGCISSGNYQ
ncbi:hypothetical protein SAY87_029931 [Trapa incisa]|uniref:Uncharacterized protein n=1 Tax=Trapa incisa TaxID=236973 RepID=A0AAN7Q9S0_9MYRT|nr:hypothetical protein SAY87_029931 [Trapa incisa]